MNDLITHTAQLPDTIEDLSRFVLVNEERVQALRAQIRAIKKVSLAKEVYEQKLAEAQEIGQITVEAAQKMGELLLQIQKHSGARTDLTSLPYGKEVRTKTEITAEMGMNPKQVSQYQQMAQNPEAVQAAIQKAIENGDVVSRTAVMREIQQARAEAREEARQEAHATIEQLRRDNRTLANRAAGKTMVVAPEDYEQVKSKADAYDEETRRLNQKLDVVYKEKRKLEETIRELEAQTVREQTNNDFVAGAVYFIAQCGSFIRDVGGYVWIADKLAELPERDRQGYIKAAMAVRDWATVLLQNIERSECGKQEIERIGVESIKE